MASVIIPQKRQSPATALLPIAGAAAGSYFGGPAGGMAGGQIGSQIANANVSEAQPVQPYKSQVSTAMSRRAETEDPHNQLMSAYKALDTMPKEMQETYRQPLTDALNASFKERERGYA